MQLTQTIQGYKWKTRQDINHIGVNERQKYLHHGSFLKYVVIYMMQINPENIGVWMKKKH